MQVKEIEAFLFWDWTWEAKAALTQTACHKWKLSQIILKGRKTVYQVESLPICYLSRQLEGKGPIRKVTAK